MIFLVLNKSVRAGVSLVVGSPSSFSIDPQIGYNKSIYIVFDLVCSVGRLEQINKNGVSKALFC